MTRKSKKGAVTTAAQFDPKLMEALVPGPLTPEQANALFHGFKKAVFERALGAELTHRALTGQVAAAAAWPLGLRHDEIVMALPIAHIMGFVAVMAPAMAGVPIYFLDRFSPTKVLSQRK